VQQRADAVIARVVRGPAWSDQSRTTLVARIESFLGEGMTIDIEFASFIPLEASGKYRFSISSLSD
jgi:hypothetical protein